MQPGDQIEVETAEEKIKGTYIPSPDSDTLIVKLPSGYNIGVSRKRIKSVKLMQHTTVAAKTAPAAPQALSKGLRKITILHTGGTIASKVDYRTGAVIARFTPEEILGMLPELTEIASIDSRLLSNMWSEDMRFAHYNAMAKEVAKEEGNGVDGVIVTHGTDTLHYSAAALAFALQGIGIPVIMVGSQRSSDRGSSDAALNLISAAYFISNSDFSGIAICMHETISDTTCLILPPAKTRKMHTSRRDAFRPINATPIARVDYAERKIGFMQAYQKRDRQRRAEPRLFKENLKIGILKAHPNLYPQEIEAYNGFDGLVIEGFALGHFPIDKVDEHTEIHKKNLEAIERLCGQMPVVMASQAIYGRLQMNVYSTGRDLQKAGVLGHLSDMTPETTFIKLAWLLSNYPTEKAAGLMTKNLIGEISERTEMDTFLT